MSQETPKFVTVDPHVGCPATTVLFDEMIVGIRMYVIRDMVVNYLVVGVEVVLGAREWLPL